MWGGKCGEFVAQHIFKAGTLDYCRNSHLLNKRALNREWTHFTVVDILIEYIQQDLVNWPAGRVCNSIAVLRVGFRDTGAGVTLYLLCFGETVLVTVLPQELPDIRSRRTNNVHVYRESPGGIQVQHQGGSSFENERATGPYKGFQQRKGTDSFLYKCGVCDIGN